ncbi:MAG: protein translocase subunit SecF [Patescibacteria group bacterium]
MKNFNLIKYRNYFLGFSGIMVVLAFVLVGVVGLKPGIDLRGGMQWEIQFSDKAISEDVVRAALRTVKQEGEQSVRKTEQGTFIIRLPNISQEERDSYKNALSAVNTYSELSFSDISPTIGDELRRRAIMAIILVLFGISFYIAYAFRKVSKPISSWKYGFATLISLFHDVAIPTGLLALLGLWKGVEIDTNFIVALLVVMGFSVHDTIVVFDRIRENLIVRRGKEEFAEIINISVRETFARSINTTLTLIIVLVALLIFGPSSLYYFVLIILVGTIFGTYSSIFLASPLLYLWARHGVK